MPTSKDTYGFTLVELSIVMVIVGLIIGGILVGKDLINSAGNRAYISQLENYNSVINTFKEKYGCIPGDCSYATNLGFTAGNGDGNNIIGGLVTYTSWPTISIPDYIIDPSHNSVILFLNWTGTFDRYEARYIWHHLRSALLIPEFIKNLVVADGSGAGTAIPFAKNDGTGIAVTGWAGKHYYRSGVMATRAGANAMFVLNFSPANAAYIFKKMGGSTITTTRNHNDYYPDDLGKERVIVSNAIPTFDTPYDTMWYRFQTQGIGGENADYCIDTSVSPAYFNIQNPKKLCSLIIQANF